MKRTFAAILSAAALGLAMTQLADAQTQRPREGKARDGKMKGLIDQGRYLVQIAGCNDCHTPGYMEAGGKIDEKLWLTGDRLAWRGPWGTTYAINLRLYMQKLTEVQWLDNARTMKPRPPMPWFNIQVMSDRDLRALYYYIKSLSPAGEPAPAYLPPDQEPPQGPTVRFSG